MNGFFRRNAALMFMSPHHQVEEALDEMLGDEVGVAHMGCPVLKKRTRLITTGQLVLKLASEHTWWMTSILNQVLASSSGWNIFTRCSLNAERISVKQSKIA